MMKRVLFGVVAVLILSCILQAQEKEIKIMPLGNSITQGRGGKNEASYRRHLWVQLHESGYENIDFVGSMNNVFGNEQDHYNDYDTHHEGHWNWSASDILHGTTEGRLGAYNKDYDFGQGYTGGKLSMWLKDFKPDIVLMHVGSNDVLRTDAAIDIDEFTSTTRYAIVDTLKQIIAEIRKQNADATIFWAGIIPNDRIENAEERTLALNELIKSEASLLDSYHSRVFYVDQHTGFDALRGRDTYDDIHPNLRGAKKMADIWFVHLSSYLDGNAPAYEGPGFEVKIERNLPLIHGKEFPLAITNARNPGNHELLDEIHRVYVKTNLLQANSYIFQGPVHFTKGEGVFYLTLTPGQHILEVTIDDFPYKGLSDVVDVLQSDTPISKGRMYYGNTNGPGAHRPIRLSSGSSFSDESEILQLAEETSCCLIYLRQKQLVINTPEGMISRAIMYNLYGQVERVLHMHDFPESVFAVDQLTPGIYIITLVGDNGYRHSKKVLIE